MNTNKPPFIFRFPVMAGMAILNGIAFSHGNYKFLVGLDFAIVIIILAQIREKP